MASPLTRMRSRATTTPPGRRISVAVSSQSKLPSAPLGVCMKKPSQASTPAPTSASITMRWRSLLPGNRISGLGRYSSQAPSPAFSVTSWHAMPPPRIPCTTAADGVVKRASAPGSAVTDRDSSSPSNKPPEADCRMTVAMSLKPASRRKTSATEKG